MKKQKTWVIYSLAAGLIFSGASAARAAAGASDPAKYGFIDVAKIFDEYQKTKENDRVLQAAGKKKEEERDNYVREVRQMKDELALLADDAKAKKQDALTNKIKELQDFDNDTRRALGEQRNGVVREIFKDIDDVVRGLGERKGLEFIFNDRALLYHNPKFDLTRDAIDQLNKNYTTKKPAGKKK